MSKAYILQKDLLYMNGDSGVTYGAGMKLIKEFNTPYYRFSDGNLIYDRMVENNSSWFLPEENKTTDSFQDYFWTDELVELAVQDALNDDNPSPLTPYGIKKKVEQFKQSHTPKPQAENKPDIPKTSKSMTTDYEPFENRVGFDKPDRDWEIISVHQGQGSYQDVDKNGKVRYAHFSDCTIEDALQNRGYKIHSVKRLSDGEVFSVGDEVRYSPTSRYGSFRIHHMRISTIPSDAHRLLIFDDANESICEEIDSHLEKLPPQPQKLKLFTTEDGVDVYDGDMYFIMNTHNHHIAPNYYRAYKSCLTGDKPTIKYFSTKEAAEKYLAENKPQPQKEKQPPQRCGICGGELVLIRGRYPNTDKREVCPTCNTERLEQINEISSKGYGQVYQVK